MSANIIRLLPDHVANQIAAGEVVQRPASVVKELLENAVDAQSTSVKLIIKDAGKTLIQVVDNGVGMNETDARLCFERHATSKITRAEDLFNLHTKGFRGEALASIAAIAHVELKTKPEDAELGTHLVIEGSKVASQELAVLPKGTSILVKNLFYNIPARRNFLKSDKVEFRHVIDEFQRVALAHPNVAFEMFHNGSDVFQLPAGNLRKRIVGIMGNKLDEKLVPVHEQTEIAEIYGFVTKPEAARKTRGEQFLFVNDRFVKSAYLHHAIVAAYEGLLREGTHPAYYIYLNLPPNTIDINIHPTKTEIKFDDDSALYAIIRATVKHSLGQFSIAPVLDFNRNPELDTPYEMQGNASVKPTVEVDTNYNPFAEKSTSGFKPSRSIGGTAKPANWDTLYSNIPSSTDEILSSGGHTVESELPSENLFSGQVSEEKQSNLVFQIHKKYIVSPIKSGMVIIDQRRAHQKILFERYINIFQNKNSSSQQLLFPLQLYFSASEIIMLKEMQTHLSELGFVFEKIEQESIVISGVPVGISESEASIVLEDLLNDWQNDLPDDTEVLQEHLAKAMAQSLALKSGTILSAEEQQNIVNSLFACPDPQVSPFGKPTYVIQNIEEIDKKFIL
ncbi:DNA mismatch repair endonuclease MutL [Avrilella dinanensis]|uniref:DNA mismatch repair protein MutL n=1 Tax=Avrilella dinanensis TaxID=2008672 RepID=A0A2M9R2E3_9FLAO|nr:DNA mismatch repair endonuclease MutL [Avrilella dinanensis]PJR03027.1 DNA mismatch repair protein MutL [Avrilella dinanensis]